MTGISNTNEQKSTSLISLGKQFFALYRPYFGFHKTKKWRLLCAAVIVALNFANALTQIFINRAMDSFLAVLKAGVPFGNILFLLVNFLGSLPFLVS